MSKYEISINEKNGFYCITLNDQVLVGSLYGGTTKAIKEWKITIDDLIRVIPELKKLIDKKEKMENAIKEVLSRNKNQQLVNCFFPKNEEEKELIKLFNEVLKLINKTLSEVLENDK